MSTKPQNLPFSCLPRLYFLLSAIVALYLSRVLYKSTLFMQNKPNFDKGQNKPNPLYKRDLRKFFTPSDNEKQTQNKPNLLNAQMNVNTVITMNYEQITLNNANKNKPNSNPISNPAFCRLPSVFCLPAKYEMRITNSLLRLVSGCFCSAIRLCA